MRIPITISSSLSGNEGDCEVVPQQVEPNVGTTMRESAYQGNHPNQPISIGIDAEVRRYFREYKQLFQELMGDEFTSP